MANRDLLADRARSSWPRNRSPIDFDLPDRDGLHAASSALRPGSAAGRFGRSSPPRPSARRRPAAGSAPLLVAARSSYYLPMMAGSVVGRPAWVGTASGAYLAITGIAGACRWDTGIGEKIIR